MLPLERSMRSLRKGSKTGEQNRAFVLTDSDKRFWVGNGKKSLTRGIKIGVF